MIRVAAVVLLLAGCAVRPDHAPWNPREGVVAPTTKHFFACLVVDTEESGRSSDGVAFHRTFYLYDSDGDYLTHFPNEFAEPVRLEPGKYVVVTHVGTVDRRIQVDVQPDHLTWVRLKDLQTAPAVPR